MANDAEDQLDAAAQRELGTARQPASILLTRIQHTAHNPALNRATEAARLRSPATSSIPNRQGPDLQPAPQTPATTVGQHHQRRR